MRFLRNNSRGVTLIELLVAMTILASLMAVVYAGLNVALTMWQNAGRRAESFEETQTALAIMRAQVRGALPLLYLPDSTDTQPRPQRLAFEGEEHRMRFVSGTSWGDGSHAVPRWIQWTVQEGRISVAERRILSPTNAAAGQPAWTSDLPLLENASFRFLRRAIPDRPAEWRNSWDGGELRELPAAVEVRYVYRGEPATLTIPLDYADANWRGYQLE